MLVKPRPARAGAVTARWPAAGAHGTDEEKRERERGGTALHAAPLRKADGGARDIRIAGMCPYGELRRLRRLGLRCQDEREGEEEQEGVREDGGLTLSAMARSEKSGAAGIGAERERRRRSETEGTARFRRLEGSRHGAVGEDGEELEAERMAASVCLRAAGVDGELDGGAPAGDGAYTDGGVGAIPGRALGPAGRGR